jgi:ubiquinone/menaquinone biosynthesis C-methylase UbiE
MDGRDHYQLDDSAPELYERYLVPAITSIWAGDLIERAKPKPTEHLLDVACGTGAVARLAAGCVTDGRIVGLDYNPGMLGVARSIRTTSAPIEWIEGSALSLPFADGTFDLVLCQLGLQFFPDRLLAVREIRRVLRPQGRTALSVYSPIERTPAAHAFVLALDEHLGPDASKIKRAEHLFSNPQEVATLLDDAGFEQAEVSTVTKQIMFPSVLDYVRFQLIATPMASLLGGRSDTAREVDIRQIATRTEVRLAAEMLVGGRLRFPQEAYVATALRADKERETA